MVKINRLTYLTFELNALVDQGYTMPLEETKRLCEEKTIFEELKRRFPFKETGLDLSMLDALEAREELSEGFQDFVGIRERKKFGIQNNGLCLLIAYAQEKIQQEARRLSK